jgi:hypothetical protein
VFLDVRNLIPGSIPKFKIFEQGHQSIGCSFKFMLKVGIEEWTVNAPWITERSRISFISLNLTSLSALFVFLLCRLTSGAFTIDYSTPTDAIFK